MVRRLPLFLVLGILCLLWGQWALARPAAPPRSRPAWERDVGWRQARRPTRATQRRLAWSQVSDRLVSPQQLQKEVHHLRQSGVAQVTTFGQVGELPLYRVDVPPLPPKQQPGKRGAKKGRRGAQRPLRVLVTAGIHGNEPVGVATALALLRRVTKDKAFRRQFHLTVMPMLNLPGNRKTPDGTDLNRAFTTGAWAPASRALRDNLKNERFDLTVDLHASYREGYFLLRGSNDQKLSRRILSAMNGHALLDASPQEPQVGPYHLHSLGGAASQTVGTLKGFWTQKGVPYSYTLEAPRTLSPTKQTQGMVKLLRSTLHNVARHGSFSPEP